METYCDKISKDISTLGISKRACTKLRKSGINNIEELLAFMAVPNNGFKIKGFNLLSMKEVHTKVISHFPNAIIRWDQKDTNII